MREIINPEKIIYWDEAIKQVKARLGKNLPKAWELRSYQYLAEHPLISAKGIHGQLHVARVWVHGRVLGGLIDGVFNQQAVDLFAIEHDRQRYNDGYDWFHGIRAAKDMMVRLKQAVDPVTLELAAKICYWHVFPEQLVPHKLRQTSEWQIATHADALDRTRNGEPHDIGDLNLKYLKLQESLLLIDIARELAARSNNSRENPFTAVETAGLEMGLLQ
jgi:hypothetical protein